MVALLATIAAFAAIASAVPHAHRHAHAHHHKARDLEVLPGTADSAPLAGRSVSYDGSCGSWGGHTCPVGSCCGRNGWCGNGTGFCGAGCQTGFGECGTSTAPVVAAQYASPPVDTAAPAGYAAPASLEISPNGLCGQDVGYTCEGSNFGDSCSKWNYCGSNSSYSGDGCQSQYGSCGESVAPASGAAAPTAPQYTAPASSASTVTGSAQAGIHTKNPGSPPAYGPPGYSAPVTLVTKTLPAQTTAAAANSAVQSSAPAYSAPPASSISSYVASAPPAYTPSQAPTSTVASAETTSPAPPPAYSSSASSPASSSATGSPYIQTYKGDGSANAGWPTQDKWLKFDDLWSINVPVMKQSCESAFKVADNTDDEIAAIKSAITTQALSTGLNEAFILAIMMQESIGCVRAPTTSYSVTNPGLFQSHNGAGSCNNGNVKNPCPPSEIDQMVKDGVSGTTDGDGLKQLLDTCQGTDAQAYYETSRKYNSGSIASSGNLGQGVATHCYASDIANRLQGWTQGNTGCDADTVGS